MKYLGIDYGTKRVGLALSDEGGEMAFPKEVVVRDYNFFSYLLNFIHAQKVEAVVIGSSYRQDGVANPVMGEIEELKKSLEEKGVRVFFEREDFSSMHAGLEPGNRQKLDASAAAIILERFLARKKGGLV
jgi:putative Holliday junction resolvase